MTNLFKSSPMFDSIEIIRESPLTLIERQQQWTLGNMYERGNEFVWRVTVDQDTRYYFEDASRAANVFLATDALRLECNHKVMAVHKCRFTRACVACDDQQNTLCRCGNCRNCGLPIDETEVVRETEQASRKRKR